MAEISREDDEEYFSDWTRIDGERLTVLIFGQGRQHDELAKLVAKDIDFVEKRNG